MGIIYKGLTFDGVNSLDYGIYITGEGVYNAPTRDVELITVAGRNGDFALDRGRFNNISVVYKAGSFAKTQTEFAEKISDFRNAILSKVGYKRLEDDYHTDEYRMAVYMNGLELEPVHYSEAGEFELTFNCKPQRFLKSGETEISVDSGDELTNPTLFESQPILLVEGHGDIEINGDLITIDNVPIGEVIIANESSMEGNGTIEFPVPSAKLTSGDVITVGASSTSFLVEAGSATIDSITATQTATSISAAFTSEILSDGASARCLIQFGSTSFQYGTDEHKRANFSIQVTYTANGTSQTKTITFSFREFLVGDVMTLEMYSSGLSPVYMSDKHTSFGNIKADSTKSALGDPMYIDCEIGEAYKIEDGEVISVNNAVLLPADLPTLATGNNTITFDNTITDLKVVARWWKI